MFPYYLLHFGIMFLTMSMLFKQRVPDAVTNRRHSGLSKAMLFAQQVGCVSNVVKTRKHRSRSGMQAFWLETPIKTKLSIYIGVNMPQLSALYT